MKNNSVKKLAQSAMIAALYTALTLIFAPISFGTAQSLECRVSEVLSVLPVFTPAAVPGLFVGCLLGNILGGAPLWDIVLGSAATLAAAFLTYKLRKKARIIALLPPVIINAVVVGTYLPIVYQMPVPVYLSILCVGASQCITSLCGGLILGKALEKTNASRLMK